VTASIHVQEQPGGNMTDRQITLRVNGEAHKLSVAEDTPLLYVLRDLLALNGPQYGCGEEACGACKVLVGANAQPSCRLPVGEVEGSEITTLEGLSEGGELHPVQQAFIDGQVLQCGICANGMIMEAAALVVRQNPSEERIATALRDNLCRCGTHPRVVRAVKRAAEAIWGPS
jgi:nicotinate dehydrogenase subunit A